MKQYAITINAVFDSIEELETAIVNILNMSKRVGIDNYPNCLSNNYDFDLIKSDNKKVTDWLNKRRLGLLLQHTQAFIDCKENYKSILDNLDEYVNKNDLNRNQIESLLKDLI